MAKDAHEMETLKEGTWYIRGCDGLEKYFKTIASYMYGGLHGCGYFIEDGRWDWDPVENLQDRTEITLQDYLDSLKPQSFDELDLEFEEKVKGSIEFLKSRGYFVTKKPKLTLAELAEKAGLDINNIEIIE